MDPVNSDVTISSLPSPPIVSDGQQQQQQQPQQQQQQFLNPAFYGYQPMPFPFHGQQIGYNELPRFAVPQQGSASTAVQQHGAPSSSAAQMTVPPALHHNCASQDELNKAVKMIEDIQKKHNDLQHYCNDLHRAITGGDVENDLLHLKPFDIMKVRRNLVIELRFHDHGKKKVDVAKAFKKASQLCPADTHGLKLASVLARRTYVEIFGENNLKLYSTTRKTSIHVTRGDFIAVPSTLPEAVVELVCDGFGIVGNLNQTYFAMGIRSAVAETVHNLFNNARRSDKPRKRRAVDDNNRPGTGSDTHPDTNRNGPPRHSRRNDDDRPCSSTDRPTAVLRRESDTSTNHRHGSVDSISGSFSPDVFAEELDDFSE